ncbi:chemotaxis protein CheD [Chachezhania sediminis]|uniref:chemotaxis protein CheD n=1 Tax=Chachezhania sediminis TaxID=2599291 RepID=UPI00131B90BE|nr:chemotaxis protein CheD [Chachezhania sediminis]
MIENGLRTITVLQGEYKLSAEPDVVLVTILGSCIATCLWDEGAGVGGMNHFLLPGDPDDKNGNLRYGVNSMELLINAMLQKGARRSELRAKVFGGAKMTKGSNSIGKSNSEFAFWFLAEEGIHCVAHCVGGTMGRKIRFRPSTGQVQRMFLQDAIPSEPTLVRPSRPSAPPAAAGAGDITLFD